ncbi:MAG: chemotaxis protein CheW [Oscillochloridaceae bacterium umkhey_bin13]
MSNPVLPETNASSDFLVIRVSDELYALPGATVREVARWREPTPVPGAPPTLPGIISQRGVILPVVDLRHLLGLPAAAPTRQSRLVIARHETIEVALVVDAVFDLLPLPAANLTPPPAALDQQRARLLSAVARHDDRPLGILNLSALTTALQEGLG